MGTFVCIPRGPDRCLGIAGRVVGNIALSDFLVLQAHLHLLRGAGQIGILLRGENVREDIVLDQGGLT